MPKDYLAMERQSKSDAVHYGIKGMKWGIRRSRAQLRAEKAKSVQVKDPKTGEVHKITTTKKGKVLGDSGQDVADKAKLLAEGERVEPRKVVGAASGETSSQRYARLAAEAKAGRADLMDEQDLKFFNARTEALAKINKLNQQNPSWLSDTTKKVLQQTAQNSMQSVSDAVAKKYLTGPLIESLTKQAKKED